MFDDESALDNRLLTADEAVALLGVSRQTLYAYTSRGLVRAFVDPVNPKRSLYDPGDVQTLKERKVRGRSRRDVAASTIDWGDPVLTSTITRIVDGKLFYRGKDAIQLSRASTLEDVSALLWDCGPLPPPCAPEKLKPVHTSVNYGNPGQRCIEAMAKMTGCGVWSLSSDRALPDAVDICQQTAAAAAGLSQYRDGLSAHEILAEGWRQSGAGAELIRRALVLCADHELNASTYAARVVASTRASLGASVLAGLCALSGPLHGGMTDAVRAMASDRLTVSSPEDALTARIARGDHVVGFGHRLYPKGDPRAAELIEALDLAPRLQRITDAGIKATGTYPNIDFALVMLEKQLHLPVGAASGIFASGRAVGWVAHALEQWSHGTVIRPRASYVGQ